MATYRSVGLKRIVHKASDRVKLLEGEQHLIIDSPCQSVSRITLNLHYLNQGNTHKSTRPRNN